MSDPARVFTAIAFGAAEATGAASAALIRQDDDEELRVVAVAGSQPAHAPGDVLDGTESLGFTLASGQPLSIGPRREKLGEGGRWRTHPAALSVPCLGAEGVLGALELRAVAGAPAFPPEAARTASLFAEVAGAALGEAGLGAATAPRPEELGAELARLAEADPARYAAIASVVGTLLANA